MRRRPCNCGCGCNGYPCLISSGSSVCFDRTIYANFSEDFDQGVLQDGWTSDNFAINTTLERGTHKSGNYTSDSVIGAAFVDPPRCSFLFTAASFYYTSSTEGSGNLALNGGPSLSLSNKTVTLTLPDGSGLVVDNNFVSGDRYGISLNILLKPLGYANTLTINKYRNSEKGAAWCSTARGDEAGEANYDYITPYSGCQYSQCELFTTGIEPTGSTAYAISDPPTSTISISGNWTIDNYCFTGYEAEINRLLGTYGYDGDCAESCDFTIAPTYIAYTLPCRSGGPSGPVVTESGLTPYLIWEAYDDRYLLNEDDWRCGIAPPGSSSIVYLRTTHKQYTVDLMESGIWAIYPYRATHSFDCHDSDPFDEETDCLLIDFTGYPCNIDSYAPPFLSIDNIAYLRESRETDNQGNVCYNEDTNCLQAGNGSEVFAPMVSSGETIYTTNMSMLTIPRDDRYSVARHYAPFGYTCDLIDSGIPDFYRVDKRGYRLNWDSENNWWSGQFQFLNASGSTVGDVGGSGSTVNWEGFDCGLIYKSGVPQIYDMYIYYNCVDGNANVELYNADTSGLYSQKTGFSAINAAIMSEIEMLYDHTINSISENNGLSYIRCDGSQLTQDGFAEPVNMITHSYYYGVSGSLADYYDSLGSEGVICGSGSCQPSGYYSFDLACLRGYDLDVGADCSDQSILPPILMDSFGSVLIRGYSYNNNNTRLGIAVDPTVAPYSSYSCVLGVDRKIYDLASSESASLLYTASHGPFIVNASDLCDSFVYGNIPMWDGYVVGKLMAMSTNFPSITGTTFAYDDYTIAYDFKIVGCNVFLFLDQNNNNLKAFIRPCGGNLPYYQRCSYGIDSSDNFYVLPNGFYKSESDMTSGNYFANVEVLQTSPLKLKLSQTFMAFGVPNDGTLESDCAAEVLYPYLIEVYLDEPEIGIVT